MTLQKTVAEQFATLHQAERGFVMPNAWDAGSALLLAEAGFPAIATTSAGIAFSLGRPDYQAARPDLRVARDAMVDRIRQITEAADLPVNGDLEAGYGEAPELVAETIRLAIEAGLAGGNIEDRDPDRGTLYDETLAVARIRAAAEAGAGRFVLTARTDGFLTGAEDVLALSIRRANLFREAGADCLYVPGVADLETVATLVREIDGPINVVTGLGRAAMGVPHLLDVGVQRISLGGTIARSCLGFLRRAAEELRDRGTIGFAADQMSDDALNALFSRARP